jgi:endonuclease-3
MGVKRLLTRAARDETPRQRRTRAGRIVRLLRRDYPASETALQHADALQLLVATILSAQCTDERVNQVTPGLFERYPDAAAYANARPADVEQLIRPTGFFRNKTKAIIGLGRALIERHEGLVPKRMEQLVELPGVGRKTANVLLGTWFGQPAIPVDTHVKRVSHRLELTTNADPVRIERDLQELLPERDWTFTSHALIWHGRRVCKARTPNCAACSLLADCPFPTE